MSINSTKVKVYPTGYRGKNGEGKIFNPESRGFNEENYTRITANLADYNDNEGSFVITKDTNKTPFEFVIKGYYFKISDTLATLLSDQSSSEVYACVMIKELGTPSNDNTDFKIRVLTTDLQTCLDTDSYEFVGLTLTSVPTQEADKYYLLLAKKGEDNQYHIPETSFLKFNSESIKGGTIEDEGDKPLNELLQTEKIETSDLEITNEANINKLKVTSLNSDLIPDATETRKLGSISKRFDEFYTKDGVIDNARMGTLEVDDEAIFGYVSLNPELQHVRVSIRPYTYLAINKNFHDDYDIMLYGATEVNQNVKRFLAGGETTVQGGHIVKLISPSTDVATLMHYGGTSDDYDGLADGSCEFTLDTSNPSALIESCPVFVIYPQITHKDVVDYNPITGVPFRAQFYKSNTWLYSESAFYLQPVRWISNENKYEWKITPSLSRGGIDGTSFYGNTIRYKGILYRIH